MKNDANGGARAPVFTLVCPVHDQLSHNRVFWETLNRYTYHPFRLIVIDNASSDGSGDFFREAGATVLRQERNTPYPEGMNLGTAESATEFVCHINNDVIVGVHWDRILLEAMERDALDIACPSSLEFMPTLRETRKGLRRWRKVGRRHPGASPEELYAIWRRMYGDWEAYCAAFAKRSAGRTVDGINGHTVMVRKSSFLRLGGLDERVIGSDWDLFLTAKKREVTVGDVKAPKIVLDAYVHHFMQATARSTKVFYEGKQPIITDLWKKWDMDEVERLWPFPASIHPHPRFFAEPLRCIRFHFKRLFDLYEYGEDW
jgi:GT2 family glycosyltransferase